jgi:hypothetical protein
MRNATAVFKINATLIAELKFAAALQAALATSAGKKFTRRRYRESHPRSATAAQYGAKAQALKPQELHRIKVSTLTKVWV